MSALQRDLGRLIGSDAVSSSQSDLLACGRDMWPRALLPSDGPEVHPPDLVAWPRSTREVQALVRYAARRQVPIVPFGAGSGVCGGAVPVHGGIVLDMKRMRRAVSIDAADHRATFECGVIGQHLEERLEASGLTLGHFPSSIYCSTLGGWVAARSAGQFSSRYGKIEDMVLGVQVVDGLGRVHETDRERSPDLTSLFVGSEGTLGVLTRACLRVWPAPELRSMRAYRFPDVESALSAMRQIMQMGLRPAVLRLYDELETATSSLLGRNDHRNQTKRRMPVPSRVFIRSLGLPRVVNRVARASARKGALLVVGFEGPRGRVGVEVNVGHSTFEAAGGVDLGEEPGLTWLHDRYRVSYKQSPIFVAGAFVDTMEVAASWSHLSKLYEAVLAAISRYALVMAHFSHAYPEGCSIYFTFVAPRGEGCVELYDRLWNDALAASIAQGGTLSHHHGVGLLKSAFMEREHGGALGLLRKAKRALDPQGILNPGKVGL